jgi:flagellar protein FlaF
MSIKEYARTAIQTDDPRKVEYRAFLAVTQELERSRESQPTDDNVKKALWRNQKLWGLLRGDLMNEQNALPSDLKARLVSLSLYVDKHTSHFLAGTAKLDTLIDINRSIMAGLNGQTPGPQEGARNAA